MTANFVIVEPVGTNPHCKYFHFRLPIEGYFIWDRAHGCTLDQADGHPTLEAVKAIAGVDHFMLSSAHSLMVSKAHVYEWDEIEPRVVAELEAHNSLAEAL
jgi:hypothetical protein